MSRIAGQFLVLLSLSGCISFTGPNDKKQGDAKGEKTPPALPSPPATTLASGHPALPTNAMWTPHPGHGPQASPVQPNAVAAKLTPPDNSTPLPVGPQTQHAAYRGQSGTPRPFPDFHPDMPVVVTPPHELVKQRGEDAPEVPPPTVKQKREPRLVSPVLHEDATPQPVQMPRNEKKPAEKKSATAEVKTVKSGAPLMRFVNNKRITLNFEVKDKPASGVSGIDLWFTLEGRDWKKHEAPAKASAYMIEVDDEGWYGFTLIARSGVGLAKDPPTSGDLPQVWVIVDLTRPMVELEKATPSQTAKGRSVEIKWRATDKNLGSNPITISYTDKEDGPWRVIAANQPNSGKYTWDMPADVPPVLLMRIEASDLAGNVGMAQTLRPVVLESKQPEISIIGVESSSGDR